MRKMFSRKLLVIATSGIMLGILAASVFVNHTAQPATASSHREAPLITADPLADNTDVYAFRSTEAGRDGFVTLIANWIPFQEPSGGPHFYKFDDTVLYEIKVDNTGDGLEDITYQFRFTTQILNPGVILGMAAGNENGPITSLTDPDYNEPQTYTVRRIDRLSGRQGRLIASGLRTPPNNIGDRTTPNYEASLALPAVYNLPGGGKVFAGQRDEGFYIDVGGAFDTFNFRSIGSTGGVDSLAGFNVNTVAIEIPIQELTRNRTVPASSTVPEAVIGVWATASRRTTTIIRPDGTRSIEGPFIQISRLGNPLVNELVIPTGLKDAFNSLSPTGDAIAAPFVLDPQLAKYLQAAFGITIPPAPRNDLVQIFATGIPVNAVTGPTYTTFLSDGVPHEYIRLNVAIAPSANPSRLGLLGLDFAGFPNGRRVGDDVVDIALRAVAGGTPFTPPTNVAPNNTLGDGVDRNDVPYLTRFPYLGTPHSGNTTTGVPHEHHVLR
ncbi:MAG: DUF4331 domain-containing protein [Pyrinomonadaceae bacterium]|nr:DUF4331 domain-containing protein [Pyrinomonadaceae bacterium]